MELNEKRYKRQCPFCKRFVEGTYPRNAFCECGAKYYGESDIWLDRERKKEVKGELWKIKN